MLPSVKRQRALLNPRQSRERDLGKRHVGRAGAPVLLEAKVDKGNENVEREWQRGEAGRVGDCAGIVLPKVTFQRHDENLLILAVIARRRDPAQTELALHLEADAQGHAR